MEIKRWLYYVVVNCALVCCIVGKPISLNKIIEAELLEGAPTTISPKFEGPEPVSERFSLNTGLKPTSQISKKYKGTGTALNLNSLSSKISPLKYRKTFQIKSPLKPKRVKQSLRIGHKRKNQAVKREIDGNAILNQKYIPLLKSLGMLFDDILGSGSGESFEVPKSKRKRLRYFLSPEGDDDVSCQCARQRESNADSESEKTTTSFSEALSTDISVTTEAPTEATDNTSAGNLRSFRPNKNVSLLLPRNSFGTRRNNHGLGEGSRTAHNGSAERDISGDHGDSEHNPKWRENVSSAQSDEEYTWSASRNSASGVRNPGRIRGRADPGTNTEEIYENDAIPKNETENNSNGPRRHVVEHNGQDKLKIRRDKAKGANFLQKSLRRKGGFLSERKISDSAESVQSKEDNEESDVSLAHNSSGNQRVFNRNGSPSSKDQKASPRHETVKDQSVEVVKPRYYSTKFTKKLLTNPLQKQRKFQSANNFGNTAHPIHSQEDSEETDISIVQNNSDDQIVNIKKGSVYLKDQKSRSRHETAIHHSSEVGKYKYLSIKPTKKNLREPLGKRRGFLSEDKIGNTAEFQSEQSDVSVPHKSSNDQRIFGTDHTFSSEDQKTSSSPETALHQSPKVAKPQYYSTKSTKTISPEPLGERRGFLSEDKNGDTAVFQSEEMDVIVSHDSPVDERIFDRDPTLFSEDQKASSKHDTAIYQSSKVDKPQYYSTKSTKTISSETLGKRRRFLSENKTGDTAEFQSEESDVIVQQHNSPDDQRIFDRDPTNAPYQKARSRYETLIPPVPELNTLNIYSTKSLKNRLPEPIVKQREFVSDNKVGDTSEAIHSIENYEQREVNFEQDNSGDQIILNEDDSSLENRKASSRHATVIKQSPEENNAHFYIRKKSSKMILPEHLERQKVFLSDDQVRETSEFTDISIVNNVGISHDNSEDQRISNRDDSASSENGEASLRHKKTQQSFEEDNTQVYTTKSTKKTLPEHLQRQLGLPSDDKVHDMSVFKEINIERNLSVAPDSSEDQIMFNKGGSSSDLKASSQHETEINQAPKVEDKDLQYDSTKSSRNKGPVVIIFDGYSVTRNKNGENKLAEKAIHIHP